MTPTKEQIIEWARKAGIAKHGLGWTCWEGQLERLTTLVAAAAYAKGQEDMRERCAKVAFDADHMGSVNLKLMKNRIGNAVRATPPAIDENPAM